MKRFDEEGGFLARALNDTRYISRLAREYLVHIAANPNGVWTSPGRMTAWMRRKWHVNDVLAEGDWKNRDNHRHHAVDAVVTAVTDRALLHRVANLSARCEEQAEERLGPIDAPWPQFRDDLREKSRAWWSRTGSTTARVAALHQRRPTASSRGIFSRTRPGRSRPCSRAVLDETSFKKTEDLEKIRDKRLANSIFEHVKAHGGTMKEALAAYRKATQVRRVQGG